MPESEYRQKNHILFLNRHPITSMERMKPSPQKLLLFLLGAVTCAMLLAFGLARLNRPSTLPFGSLHSIEGRVEVKSPGSRQWLPPIDDDPVLSGTVIRVGSHGAATLKTDSITIKLGPDSELTTLTHDAKNKSLTRQVHLHSGEIRVIRTEKSPDFVIQTNFGRVIIDSSTDVVLTQPAGQKFATLAVISGSTTIHTDRNTRQITPTSGTVLIDNLTSQGLWATNPQFAEAFAGKEGHEAIVFKWGGRSEQLTGDLLIRNLTSGEMITKESATPGFEVTLPAGSYSWIVKAQGLVTSPRRFQITGHVTNDAAETPAATSTAATTTATATATTTLPATAVVTESPTQPIAAEPKRQNIAPSHVPTSEPTSQAEPVASNNPPPENVLLELLAPKKESQVAISDVSELRIVWKTKGPARSFELDVLGSAGNPSLQFSLEGHRTRQRLKPLPPGRYSVRLRANISEGQFTPWVETFFDVIQTEAGQLAPTDVTFTANPQQAPGKILIKWQKSTAPFYQVRVQPAGESARIERVNKSQVLIPLPKSGKAVVSICALDANGHIRGCAPEISVP